MAYVTDSDMRDGELYPYISIPASGAGSVSPARMASLIASATAVVDAYTRDHFEPTSSTRRIENGAGGNFLYFDKRVRGVTSVSAYDYADVLTSITSGYYQIHSSLDITGTNLIGKQGRDGLSLRKTLTFGNGYWPAVPYYIDVAGTWDWPATPEDVKLATAMLIWSWCNNEIPPGVERVDSASLVFTRARPTSDSTGLPEVDALLMRYRRQQIMPWGASL
jgi:hypothetical protein